MKGHNISIAQLQQAMFFQGYPVFDKDHKNYNLNLIGVRSEDSTPNTFNDWFCMLWRFQGNWNLLTFPITTDPGTYWLGSERMGSENGTAVLKKGHWEKMWKVGRHKNYKALQQINEVVVLRDDNQDGKVDTDTEKEQRGIFGINCHRASQWQTTKEVGAYSAGCQVFADPQNFLHMLTIAELAAANWGNEFSYTLLDEKDIFSNDP